MVTFIIDNEEHAEYVNLAFEAIGLIATAFSYSVTTIEPSFVYTVSALLPLPAITWITKLGIIASNRGIDVNLLQENVIVNGNDMTHIFRLAMYSYLVRGLIQAYVTPFKIYNDPKKLWGPFYLCNPDWYRDWCCCCRRNQDEDEDQGRGSVMRARSFGGDQYENLNDETVDGIPVDGTDEDAQAAALGLLHMDEREMIENGTYEKPLGLPGSQETL